MAVEVRIEFHVGGFGDFSEGCDLPGNGVLEIDTDDIVMIIQQF